MIIKKILCPVDESTSAQHALNFANQLAASHNAEVDVIHVFSAELRMKDDFKSEKQKQLENTLGNSDQNITYLEGFIPNVIIEQSKDYQLVVMGSKGAHHSSRYYGSNAAQVIQNSNCPVFLVPDKPTDTNFRKIAFAADFENIKEEDPFEVLRDLADEQDSDLHLLHVSSSGTLDGDDAIELHEIFEDISHAFFVVKDDDIVNGINQHITEHQPQVLAIMPKKTTSLAHTLSQAIIDNANTIPIFSFHA